MCLSLVSNADARFGLYRIAVALHFVSFLLFFSSFGIVFFFYYFACARLFLYFMGSLYLISLLFWFWLNSSSALNCQTIWFCSNINITCDAHVRSCNHVHVSNHVLWFNRKIYFAFFSLLLFHNNKFFFALLHLKCSFSLFKLRITTFTTNMTFSHAFHGASKSVARTWGFPIHRQFNLAISFMVAVIWLHCRRYCY